MRHPDSEGVFTPSAEVDALLAMSKNKIFFTIMPFKNKDPDAESVAKVEVNSIQSECVIFLLCHTHVKIGFINRLFFKNGEIVTTY